MKSCFDTDKAFHMSFDEVTFNADRIRSKLELLSEELMPRCGLRIFMKGDHSITSIEIG